MEVELGDTVKDMVTGFKGVATAKVEYINGCKQFCVKPKITEGNKMPDGEYIDIQQLKVVKKKKVEIEKKPTGGVMPDCPKY